MIASIHIADVGTRAGLRVFRRSPNRGRVGRWDGVNPLADVAAPAAT
jgi:hypothetical protein